MENKKVDNYLSIVVRKRKKQKRKYNKMKKRTVMKIDYQEALALVKRKDFLTPEEYAKQFWEMWKPEVKEKAKKEILDWRIEE